MQWPDLLLRVPDVFVRISARRLFIQIHVFPWVSCPSKQMLGYSVKKKTITSFYIIYKSSSLITLSLQLISITTMNVTNTAL